jgi:ribosome-associated protein
LFLQLADRAAKRQQGGMISIADGILLDEREIEESFIRASGPGGQNVNKVASAVQLRFDIRRSPSLPQPVRERLERLAGSRVTQDGVLVITAQRFRSQERNRQDAVDRLVALIRRAATPPAPRRPTRPSAGARQRRLADKARRSLRKRERAAAPEE